MTYTLLRGDNFFLNIKFPKINSVNSNGVKYLFITDIGNDDDAKY